MWISCMRHVNGNKSADAGLNLQIDEHEAVTDHTCLGHTMNPTMVHKNRDTRSDYLLR